MEEFLRWLPALLALVTIVASWTTMGITIKIHSNRLDLLERDFKTHCLANEISNSSSQVILAEIRKDIFYIKEQWTRDMLYIKERLNELGKRE